MSLVTLREVLDAAVSGRYAVGAFNIYNLETAQAVAGAACDEGSPVILLVYDAHMDYMGAKASAAMCRAIAEESSVPIAVHLDHGSSLERVKLALDAGYTGVMFDGSRMPIDENIAVTTEVVNLARKYGVSIEAEVGHVGSAAKGDGLRQELMTLPEEAAALVAETEVDALAVAVGNAHGFYSHEPRLDYVRLETISTIVNIPLVLHGSTGIPDDDIRRAIRCGVRKVNIGTEMMTFFGGRLKEAFSQEPGTTIGQHELEIARQALRDKVRAKIRVLMGA